MSCITIQSFTQVSVWEVNIQFVSVSQPLMNGILLVVCDSSLGVVANMKDEAFLASKLVREFPKSFQPLHVISLSAC